jgi:hypothetical protein
MRNSLSLMALPLRGKPRSGKGCTGQSAGMSFIFVLTAERRPALLWRIISILTLVHPRATSWPSPPKGGARVCANKALHFHLSLYHPAKLATIVATPLSGCAGLTQREASHSILRSLPLPYSTAITDSRYFERHCVPSSSAVTDSLDFRVADAPLQIQFA